MGHHDNLKSTRTPSNGFRAKRRTETGLALERERPRIGYGYVVRPSVVAANA